MAKRGAERPPKDRVRDILIDISASVVVLDGGDPVTKAIAAVIGQSVPEIVLPNICKYCGPALSRAATKYTFQYVLPKITKHPNINVMANESVYYRGALGIPKRFNYKKIRNFFKKALTMEVTACGYSPGKLLGSAAKRTKKGAAALVETRKASTATAFKTQVKNFVNKAYRETSFRTGGRRRYRRNWLIEADTGKPGISGYSVFPGVGETLEDLGPSKVGSLGYYSRSGTHIMIKGGSYDPNDWRPNPSESNVIEKIIIQKLPRILAAAERALPGCLKRIKARMQKDAQRIAQRRLAEITGKTRPESIGNKEAERLAIQGINKVASAKKKTDESDIEDLNIERSLQEIAIETRKTTIQLRTEINAILKVSDGRLTVKQIIVGIRKKIGLDREE